MAFKSKAAYLPGNSTVIFKDVEFPAPGHGDVLLKVKSTTICGSFLFSLKANRAKGLILRTGRHRR